jgi:hypothetical protein
MNTENLTKALHSIGFLSEELRAAYASAVVAGDEFAQIVLLKLVGDAVELNRRIAVAHEAATVQG